MPDLVKAGRSCPVAHGVDECRDAHHGPAKANPPNIDAQRGPQDEYGREQVQGGFADQGAGQPCIRVPDTGDGQATVMPQPPATRAMRI
jgi:hypothetical protein